MKKNKTKRLETKRNKLEKIQKKLEKKVREKEEEKNSKNSQKKKPKNCQEKQVWGKNCKISLSPEIVTYRLTRVGARDVYASKN